MPSKFALLAATLLGLAPSTAFARDRQAYVGLELGAFKPEKLKLDYVRAPISVANAVVFEHRTGFDLDAIAGIDFGFVRAEGELGWKDAKISGVAVAPAVLFGNTGPLAATGNTRVLSAIANLLLDFGADDGLQVYVGGGVGAARLQFFNRITGPGVAANRGFKGEDGSLAWQAIAGMRVPVSSNVDLGLKYRYFRTNFDIRDAANAAAVETLDGRFKSHSLLASVILNFGAAPPPPPPVVPAPVEVAPPPPPPATQTCPDGSVILATDACPVAPPPPPPPPAAPERG